MMLPVLGWEELRTKIEASNFSDRWRSDGIWSTDILEAELGKDWLNRYASGNGGNPFPKANLAPQWRPALAWIIEFAARLIVLKNMPGLNKVLKNVVTQSDNGAVSHAALQLEVASLELRRVGKVQMELSNGEGHWSPDVLVARDSKSTFGVECFTMSIGYVVEDFLRNQENGVEVSDRVDGWRRVASRIIEKCAQAQTEGWLRVELDDGLFQNRRWYREDFTDESLENNAKHFCRLLRESIEGQCGELHGVVLSSPPMVESLHAASVNLGDGMVALRRHLPAGRVRETFVVPLSQFATSEAEIFEQLYDSEPTWLDWSRSRGVPPTNA